MVSSIVRTIGTFLVGMVFGILFIQSLYHKNDSFRNSPGIHGLSYSLEMMMPNGTLSQQEGPHAADEGFVESIQWQDGDAESHKRENDFVAVQLKRQVRVLCWILTSPSNLISKSIHVNATWGRRCNTLLFMTSRSSVPFNTTLPVVELDVAEGYAVLWAKTKAALGYIYDHYMDEVDWVLKADDDTFVIVENLRYLLKDHSPDDPKFFGRRFRTPRSGGLSSYMSGGAGYVLSREALRRLATLGLRGDKLCAAENRGPEDIQVGRCLEKCGVEFIDTRDAEGRHRFNPLNPGRHLTRGALGKDFWLWSYDFYPSLNGPECCSDYAVTFHYVNPYEMYSMEYLIYHVKAFGIAVNYDKREIGRRISTRSVTQPPSSKSKSTSTRTP